MPISYDRILALLNEAECFREMAYDISHEVRERCNMHAGEPLAQEILTLLSTRFTVPPLVHAIERERLHFQQHQRRMHSNKIAMRRVRAAHPSERQRTGKDGYMSQDALVEQMQKQHQQPATPSAKTASTVPTAPIWNSALPGADRVAAANERFKLEGDIFLSTDTDTETDTELN